MRVVLFCHSFLSCWNHGNAHFLRGVARELIRAGHAVSAFEPRNGWSHENAIRDGGAHHLKAAAALVPGISLHSYDLVDIDLKHATARADLVIVHEWNEPTLVARLGKLRAGGAPFTLLFHDTHHRAVSAPEELSRFDLSGYDGILAFGEVLRELYDKQGWGSRAFTWHEAADTALFRPLPAEKDCDLIWIGNWGDDERTDELREFLIGPARALGLRTRIHGVRYPAEAQQELRDARVEYLGWLPNHLAPQAFAHAPMTVHVPRRPYVAMLPGIPTIRMFEALACGIPLVSAPWHDAEGLFPSGSYLRAGDGDEMRRQLRALQNDRAMAASVAAAGLSAVQARHTCAHRLEELLTITRTLRGDPSEGSAPRIPERAVA
ncbi:MAG: hypothetical protein QOD74_1425 [Variibacter sp.]|jgi:spore maturation protein CgeB|nr:hypothetical protein [Variibacter sp.]